MCALRQAFPSEGQVQRQLHKAIAPDRLLNHSNVSCIRRRSCQWCCVQTGGRVEAAIQLEISIRRIKTRLVEDVEHVGLEPGKRGSYTERISN